MVPTRKDKVILLHDDGAQMALHTCCTMCVAAKSFDPEMRIILEDTLNVIARCCPYEIAMEPLPSLSDLPEIYQQNLDVLEQYKAFPTDDKPIGLREVMLFDALVLFRIFSQAPQPPAGLMGRLETITAGFRLSIRRLRNAVG